jgi:hypothetical protein
VTVQPERRLIRFGALRRSRPAVADQAQLTARTHVASFSRYTDAERTVDLLAHTQFPLHRLSVVGGGLKLVTDGGGRVTATRASALGACGGLWVGALMALFSIVVDRTTVGELVVRLSWGLPLGALFGTALGLTGYAIIGTTQDLAPPGRLVATRHELHVDTEIATSACRLLLKLHPVGMMLVDQVPAEVIAQPSELVLIESFESAEPPPESPGRTETPGRSEASGGPESPESTEPTHATRPPLPRFKMPAGAV